MTIDFEAYRKFLDELETAEKSGRKYHVEFLSCDSNWRSAGIDGCGPGGTYRVVYEPMECYMLVVDSCPRQDQQPAYLSRELAERAAKWDSRIVHLREVVDE